MAVATTTRSPWARAGTRYPRDLPVPVPAWTSRCDLSSTAAATASAMVTWPARSTPPTAVTAACSRSVSADGGVSVIGGQAYGQPPTTPSASARPAFRRTGPVPRC
ncbi:hypothetical protein [Streptomyces sp. NPDC021020]|uniref:hypothetical protein n=1 Tax=Streptomyces sp. NPDC021020 TaxID=3365109 RepID=UPI0037876229